jgi:glyoxylate reductase
MPKPRVFVSRVIPESGLKMLEAACDIEVWPGELPPPRNVLLEKVREVDGLLSLLTDRVDDELLDAAPKLKVVANLAVGFDNIDVDACTRRGVLCGNTPGVLTETTADFAFALLMSAARRVVEGDRYTREGKWLTWGPLLLRGQDVNHSTLGLIGLGRIGSEMAKRAKGFSMRVMYYDMFRREDLEQSLGIIFADLDTVIREADFLSIHTPLTPETRHLMNAERFKMMKPTAILINSARGPIVDTMALSDALRSGTIAGAGLDVTDPEPIPMDHPLVGAPNCIIAPHIASASVVTRSKMSEIAAGNIINGLRGEPMPAPLNQDKVTGGRK